MKITRQTIFHLSIASVVFIAIMALFLALKYLYITDVAKIYLPIFAIALTGIVLKQYIFGQVFITFAEIGLVIEYIFHIIQEEPTMKGAFINGLLIISGFILGLTAQLITNAIRRKGTS